MTPGTLPQGGDEAGRPLRSVTTRPGRGSGGGGQAFSGPGRWELGRAGQCVPEQAVGGGQATYRGLGFGLKWVFYKATPAGLQAGGFTLGRKDRALDRPALPALATYRLASGQALRAGHKVVGAKRAATWAAGYEWPLAQRLQEPPPRVYGEQRSRPASAGLRCEMAGVEGVSCRRARGNSHFLAKWAWPGGSKSRPMAPG